MSQLAGGIVGGLTHQRAGNIDLNFKRDDKLIVISDHGCCSFGEAKIQTLPQETKQGTLNGDYHENALLITVNVDCEINRPLDVFYAIKTIVR